MKPQKAIHHSLFRKWLFIEMAFLCFMLIVSLGMYLYTNTHIKKQLGALHQGSLERTRAQIDVTLQATVAAVNEYAIDPAIRTLAASGDSERALVRLVDDIKQTNATVPGIKEIVIYFPDTGLFASSAGIMDLSIFRQVYSDGTEHLQSIDYVMTQSGSADAFVPVCYSRDGALTVTGMYTKVLADGIHIMALADAARIEALLGDSLQDADDLSVIRTDRGDILFGASSLPSWVQGIEADVPGGESIEKVRIAHERYYRITTVSGETGLIYSAYIGADRFYEQYFAIQKTSMLILALATVLGVVISFVLTRYKYQPVEKVIQVSRAMTPQDLFMSSEDELQEIEAALAFIHEQARSTQSVLTEHNEYIKTDAIRMILDGEMRYPEATDHIKTLLDCDGSARYTVAVLQLNEPGSDASRSLASIRAAVTADNRAALCHILTKGGCVVMIFEGSAGAVAELLADSAFMADAAATAAVGSDSLGFGGISDSYHHALLALSRKILPDAPKVIAYTEAGCDGIVTLSAQDEIRLCGYIQSGDTRQALALFDELVSVHDTGLIDSFSYKAYLYNLSHTILRAAEGLEGPEASPALLAQAFDDVFKNGSHPQIAAALKGAIEDTAARYIQKMNSANHALNARIVAYIGKNIDNPQLSAEMAADSMHINPAYLRRFFREHNGISLWDFINMKRIEKARHLLTNTKSSIKSISAGCGYVSMSTFIRTFRKFSGMTPGHYRNLYR